MPTPLTECTSFDSLRQSLSPVYYDFCPEMFSVNGSFYIGLLLQALLSIRSRLNECCDPLIFAFDIVSDMRYSVDITQLSLIRRASSAIIYVKEWCSIVCVTLSGQAGGDVCVIAVGELSGSLVLFMATSHMWYLRRSLAVYCVMSSAVKLMLEKLLIPRSARIWNVLSSSKM
ncbi:hypothetical protein Tco_1132018 [Tanacetum coccineum]|uniref:Uncharacterized protein n=1 Tax=Tanacetum coccineum TaxID=301880 RepID=A0ABQ5JAP0_9ASTR